MGVGLTLVRALVKLHDGDVTVRSAVGEGSEFVVRLPLVGAAGLERATEAPVTIAPHLRVVLVEDNADIRVVTEQMLRSLGCEVTAAGCARVGIDLIVREAPEVALVDIGLPDMDGYALARAVRARLGANTVHLVAVTGFGQPVDREKALQSGFDDHLVKPVDVADLSRVFRDSIRRGA
jgi:CheY-like chemotaxis protein